MKRLITVVLLLICVLSFAGCQNKEQKAAEAAAIDAVEKLYTVQNQMLKDLSGFSMATQSKPTINKVEKIGEGRYVVTGSITGIHMKNSISKSWTADWNVTVEKNEDGEFEIASSPKPDYGTWNYLN